MAEDQSRMRWQGKGMPRQRIRQARTGKPGNSTLTDRHLGKSGTGVERKRERPRLTKDRNRMRWQGKGMPRLGRGRGRGTRVRVVFHREGAHGQGVDLWRAAENGGSSRRRLADVQSRMRWQGKGMPRQRISQTQTGKAATPIPADRHVGRPNAGKL